MSVPVLVDAQAGIGRILRPQNGFEALYQGTEATPLPGTPSDPIAFFQWGLGDLQPPNPRDSDAGKPGFDPDLLNFIPVSMGSRILLAIPQIALNGVPTFYRYSIVWRWKNLARYRDAQAGTYHLGTEQPGAPDGTAPPGQQIRFALPAGMETITLAGISGIDVLEALVSDSYTNFMLPVNLPIIGPGATRGHYQQGIVNPAVEGTIFGYLPDFALFDVTAKADEMMIVADRLQGESPLWNFNAGGDDAGFSNLYGTYPSDPHPNFTDVGIYVFEETTLSAPSTRLSTDLGGGGGGGGFAAAAAGPDLAVAAPEAAAVPAAARPRVLGRATLEQVRAAFAGFRKIKR